MDIRKVLHERSIDLENNLHRQQETFDISDDLKHIRKSDDCPDWCSKLRVNNKILPFSKLRIRKKKEISAETIIIEAEISLYNKNAGLDLFSEIYECRNLILVYGKPDVGSEKSLRGRLDTESVETHRITFENVLVAAISISGYSTLNSAKVLFRSLQSNVKMEHLE